MLSEVIHVGIVLFLMKLRQTLYTYLGGNTSNIQTGSTQRFIFFYTDSLREKNEGEVKNIVNLSVEAKITGITSFVMGVHAQNTSSLDYILRIQIC